MSDIPVRNRNMLGIFKKLEINICINSVMAINAYKNLSVAMSHELDIPLSRRMEDLTKLYGLQDISTNGFPLWLFRKAHPAANALWAARIATYPTPYPRHGIDRLFLKPPALVCG